MNEVLSALGIDSSAKTNHNSHFHIDLRTPPLKRLDPPRNLLADIAVLDQTSSVLTDALRAAGQGLLGEIAPRPAFDQGDLTMFFMNVPPDVPPQYAPIVVAEASQAKQQSKERTIGVCHLVESRPESRLSAVNALDPIGSVWRYLREQEQVILKDADFYAAKMTLLHAPKHGEVPLFESTQSGRYLPNVSDFEGSDQATVLVEIGGYKVKVIYFFKVMPDVPGSSDQGSPYEDKRFCPSGDVWKISFDENDPNAPIYTFTSPTQLTSALASVTQANLTFGDLPGEALGQSQGNTITLDLDAAGHGWFLDSTAWDNEEFVATSNSNEWVAKFGSEAEGKMDLLTRQADVHEPARARAAACGVRGEGHRLRT